MDPELLALLFGSPPPTTAVPPTLMPGATPIIPPTMMPQMMSSPVSLGESLDPTVPLPRSRPPEAPGGTYAAQAVPGSAGGDPSKMLATLKGVVTPPAPVAQKVSTPHAPPMAKLQGGGVAELLASLGIGPQQAFPGLKLPSTLGQALGGR